MKFLSQLRVETGRLFCCVRTWLVILLVTASPAAGLWIYRAVNSISTSSYTTSLNGTYLGNTALAGALLGALLFGFLTVLELDRVHRTHTNILTEAIVSPLSFYFSQIMALLLAAAVSQIAVLAVWFPYTSARIGSVFHPGLYLEFYLCTMLPAMVFAILFTASVYQITRRLDLTLILLAAFLLLSIKVWTENWLLRWVNPSIGYISDDFGHMRLLRSIIWNRLFWLFILLGFWCLSFLFIRRYGRGILRSAAWNARKLYLPLAAALFIAAGIRAYFQQPFLDHSKLEITDDLYNNINYNEAVTFSSIHVDARPNLKTGCQWGTAAYQLLNTAGQPQMISFRINPGYRISSVSANGTSVKYRDLNNDDQNGKMIEVDLPPAKEITLKIKYGGFPQEWNILDLSQGELEISKDYIYLANQNFAPVPWDFSWSEDDLPQFTSALSLPKEMIPVLFGDGTVEQVGTNPNGTVRWLIHDTGSTLILYAGDYISEAIQSAGINIDFYYSLKHQRVMEECGVNDIISRVFEYCTSHYGPLSFYQSSSMRLLEIGIAGGGYAGRGASVMSEDSFNEQGLKDSKKGASGSEVLAHEIVHQWWGLGNMFDNGGSNLWSSEGLTVYTTYRMVKEQYGEAYAMEHYVKEWQRKVDDYYHNYYVRHPEYLKVLPKKFRSRISNSQSSTRLYCEMPLKLLKAEQLVGGEKKMDIILKKLFNRKIDNSNPYLTYQDFLDACKLNEEDLNLE